MKNINYERRVQAQTRSLLERYEAQIIDECIELRSNQIAWDSKKNQTRFQMSDPGHLSSLVSDIESRGLLNLPTVELDPVSGKHLILSGHHRMLGMRRIQTDADPGVHKFPCTVVQFSDNVQRLRYLQGANDHVPTKGHGKKDAVFYVQSMRKIGFFTPSTSDEDLKGKTYKLLGEHYPRIKGIAKTEVFHQAFADLKLGRVKSIQKEDSQIHCQEVWESKEQFVWKEDYYYCNSEFNNSWKVAIGALRKRSIDINAGKTPSVGGSKGKIRLLTYFPSKFEIQKLREQRKEALETTTMMNRIAWDGSPIVVDQICFAPQIDGGIEISETKTIVYDWDYTNLKFKLRIDS